MGFNRGLRQDRHLSPNPMTSPVWWENSSLLFDLKGTLLTKKIYQGNQGENQDIKERNEIAHKKWEKEASWGKGFRPRRSLEGL